MQTRQVVRQMTATPDDDHRIHLPLHALTPSQKKAINILRSFTNQDPKNLQRISFKLNGSYSSYSDQVDRFLDKSLPSCKQLNN
jgi:hypothetical protein